MSSAAAKTDSNLSGKPSDDIDKQKGPATGSNVESPGSVLNAGTNPVTSGNNPTNPGGSSGNNPTNQGGSSGNNDNKNTGSGSK